MKVLVGPNNYGLEKCLPDLTRAYPQAQFVHVANPADLAKEIVDAEVYMGWVNRDLFLSAKKLKWIQSPSSGVNMYTAIPELTAGPLLLTSARGTHGACLGDHTFAMILSFTRHIRELVVEQPKHHWAIREVRGKMMELSESTMGVIGLGVVGRAVAKRANAFDMKIIAVDMYPNDKPDYVSWLRGLDSLPELLREADFVVTTVPYTEQTHNMIAAPQLALMKPTAMLLGISRGGIINEADLAKALREKRLGAAALDVTEKEPLPADSELWDIENLLITPHVAGGTQFEGRNIIRIFVENMGRYTRGEFPLRNQVDKQRGF
jgi:phosphoglycerate dehydrogenase-like enzyme